MERIVRKNKDLESKLTLTISAEHGLISQIDFFNKQISSADVSNYLLLYKGDFAYNKSYSNGFPFGAIKRLDLYDKGIISNLYIAFKADDESIANYLEVYFDTDKWHKEIITRASEGARNHGLLNISPADFFDISIMIPKSKEERDKIHGTVVSIKKEITLHQRKLSLKKLIAKL